MSQRSLRISGAVCLLLTTSACEIEGQRVHEQLLQEKGPTAAAPPPVVAPALHLSGKAGCEELGTLATGGRVRVTVGPPVDCMPLGPCDDSAAPELFSGTIEPDGSFLLVFDPTGYSRSEVYLYVDAGGTCGDGFDFWYDTFDAIGAPLNIPIMTWVN